MDELMDMIISDESPVNISDKIKEIIQLKSVEKIDTLRPYVATQVFDVPELEYNNEQEEE